MLAILDGSFLLHRALHVPAHRVMRTAAGRCSGGVFGFLRSLSFAIRDVRASRAICVWDGGRSSRRMQIYPEYKQRSPPPAVDSFDHAAEYAAARSALEPVLPRLGVRSLRMAGREGDDVIGRVCRSFSKWRPAEFMVVVSDDRDMGQLVTEWCAVYRPRADEWVTAETQMARTGVAGCQEHLLRAAILGDPSDNIGGVRGVGEVRVGQLLHAGRKLMRKGRLTLPDAVRQAAADFKLLGWARAVLRDWSIVERNLLLMDLRQEKFSREEKARIGALVRQPTYAMTRQEVAPFLREYELGSLLSGFDAWFAAFRTLV